MKELINKQLKGKRILFATVPADGHVNPLTGLAKYLQTLGCDVRWYTSPIFTNKMEDLKIPLYPFVEAIDINAGNLSEIFPERAAISDAGKKLDFDMLNFFAKRSVEYLQDIKNIHRTFPFDLMIADSMFTGIPLVKATMNIPVIAIGIIPLSTNSVDLAPYGMALPPAKNDDERAKYADLQAVTTNVVFKESIDYFSQVLSNHGIPNEKSILFDLLIKQASLYLQIGTPGFEYDRSDFGENIRFIGGLSPYATGKERLPWYDERLNQYKKVVLVTQGTIERDSKKLLEPTLSAFKDDPNILVIATTGGFDTTRLQNKFAAANIIIQDFISFTDVMPYADVYITNGGYGGTMLSIKNQLPMIAAGVHEGKNETCARVGYFHYGINLNTENPTSTEICKAVNEVLSNPHYRENVTRLGAEMRGLDPEALCANYIVQVLNEATAEISN